MTELLKILLNGENFWIEPNEELTTETDIVQLSAGSKISEIPFDLYTNTLKNICNSISDTMKKIPKEEKPTKITMEFGLSFNAEGNIYVVKTGGETNFKIIAEWENLIENEV